MTNRFVAPVIFSLSLILAGCVSSVDDPTPEKLEVQASLSSESQGCKKTYGEIIAHRLGCTVHVEQYSPDILTGSSVKSVVIVLHGDTGGSQGVSYIHKIAKEYNERMQKAGYSNFAIFTPLRRGYNDKEGNESSGTHDPRHRYKLDDAIHYEAYIESMRTRFPNAKFTIVGHSGGAALAGIIAGRRPDLQQNYVFVGTTGDIDHWRSLRNWPAQYLSPNLNPINFVDNIRPDIALFVVTSNGDGTTPRRLSVEYHDALKRAGKDSTLIDYDGVSHGALMRDRRTIRLISSIGLQHK